jgi:hypothetical protein
MDIFLCLKFLWEDVMMTKKGKKPYVQNNLIWALLVSTLVVFLLPACVPKPSQTTAPAFGLAVQPTKNTADSLQPGLSVYYMEGFWRHVELMPKPEAFLKTGSPGKAISKIDHRFGKGNVFDSGRKSGVGVQMMGFIHLSRTGEWQFMAQSNDGIEVAIENIPVASDPGQHSDRFSKPMGFQVEKSGWFSLLLRYFQRKGTATLEFYWKPPGKQDFTIIPEEAYWHMPETRL